VSAYVSQGSAEATQLDSGLAKRPVRLGVIGFGYWGPNLLRNLQELPDAEVLTLCDLRQDALDGARRRYPGIETTTNFDEVVGDDALDALIVATPVSTHYTLAKAALEAGKHVFVEKPLALSTAEAHALVDLARRQNRVLMPGHTFVYSPPVNVIRDLVQSGELGEIYFVSTSRVNLGLHQPDASVVWDLAPHDFSILLYVFGQMPTHVAAVSRSCIIADIPDVAFINLRFPSGTIAHVELSWLAPSKLRRTAIVGSQKMVVYDDTSNEPVRVFDSGVMLPNPETFGEYQLSYRTGDIVSPRVDAAEPLLLEMLDFCASVRGGGVPRSSAALGLQVVQMIEAVDASLAAGGVPIEIDRASRV
jgi:predicted dehydrogenase